MTTWIKVYNSLPAHPKMLAAAAGTVCSPGWLFVCGACYSNEHLTDGFIPAYALPVLAPGATRVEAAAQRLVTAGLWHEVQDGWRIHDYGDVQRSAAEIRDRRARDAERKATARSNGSPRGHFADSIPDSASDVPRTPPGQNTESSRARDRAPSQDVDVDVEKTPASQVTRAKRAARNVDQTKRPDGFPAELVTAGQQVLRILHGVWELRGGIEPQPRGVGLAIMRNLRADHVQVAREVEHWLTAGKGQRARCDDIAKRFGDWVAAAPAADASDANVVRGRFGVYDEAAGL